MTEQTRLRRTAALVVVLVLFLPTWSGEAHEIPADVTLQAFIKPEGGILRMLVRAPLFSMRDYDFPVRAPGSCRALTYPLNFERPSTQYAGTAR